ncbi:hypothetical protein L6164_021131 [Bauhinia variegata]|uniref:Uncharacterized protein n=1 Tax=Bauhinia variegata TaxID=167791 RepID=A0ACB9MZB0_BAUVA|nr:hypothetical protein L6164_021131 [Bauhinia variegata]
MEPFSSYLSLSLSLLCIHSLQTQLKKNYHSGIHQSQRVDLPLLIYGRGGILKKLCLQWIEAKSKSQMAELTPGPTMALQKLIPTVLSLSACEFIEIALVISFSKC